MTFRDLLRQRHFLIGLITSAVLGGALCFVPLFDLVGYESSMVVGVFVHIVSAILTVLTLRAEGVPSIRDAQRAPWQPIVLFWRLAARHMLLIVPALVLLALNAMRVPNCDWGQGLGFFALGAPFAALMGQAVGWFVMGLMPGRRKLVWGLVVGLILGNGLALGVHILLEPPINGHQWAIGYLNGSIYDEAISIPAGLLWYRVTNVALAMCAVFGLEWWRVRARTEGRNLLVMWLVWVVLWCGMTYVEQDFGIRVDRTTIAQELGGRVETEHFIIYYPNNETYREQLELMVEDHEFRYAEMQAYFGTDPVALHGEKVRSFVYPNTETKGVLMGARRTLIAKIWLREIHIMWRGYGTHLLAHELAHVFTEPFGSGPLKLSMQNGVGVNMGLVEGIATAADAPALELTLHESSAAMRAIDLAPDIRDLVGATGFWTQASGKAYTLMGSFVQFLVDEYGMERFKQVYGDGDFDAAYGKSADTLVGEWEAMIDGITLTEIQRDITRYRYERPSIFGRVCARTIAELKRRASERASAGDIAAAQAIYDVIVGYDPQRASHRLSRAKLLFQAEENEAALDVLDAMIAERGESLVPAQLAQINELRGDVLWRQGAHDEATAMYTSCLDVGVLDDARRLLLAKRDSLSAGRATWRPFMRRYLLEDLGDPVALYYPTMWRARQPDDPLAAYMLGRRLWGARRWEFAREHLDYAVRELPEGLLHAEATLMLGQTYMHLGLYEQAGQMFEALALVEWSRLQTESDEWRRRLVWKRQQRK